MTPWQRYQADLKRPDFSYDPAQERAVQHLQAIYEALLEQPRPNRLQRLMQRLRRPAREPVKGLDQRGGSGRGKTYLLDVFFDSLPCPDKRRWDSHPFMQRAH